MTYYYAQIDEARVVVGVTQVAAPMEAEHMLPLEELDISILGKRHDAETGAFVDVPVAPTTPLRHISPLAFRRRFTKAERAAIEWAAVDRPELSDPQRMQAAALAEGIVLDAISGYRSHDYQLGIFERKLARGLDVAAILAVNAAPGFSEHHSGLALDIGTPDAAPAEEAFETTPAFAWLCKHAGDYGFVMSYPRDNPHGIIYEPWHWYWRTSNA